MITLINAPGLNKRLLDAGLGIESRHYDDGRQPELVTPDDVAAQAIIDAYTVTQAAAFVAAQVYEHSKSLRDKALDGISPGEMASWPIKREEALAVQADSSAPTPMLSAEAAARQIPLADLVVRVLGNATALGHLEATIAGVAGRHRDALARCSTFEELASYDWHSGWPDV